jgi:glyoxylase-like metal-dependent hydrolase (beta-lactamase superfamily II)
VADFCPGIDFCRLKLLYYIGKIYSTRKGGGPKFFSKSFGNRMKVANGVEMLELPTLLMGAQGVVCPTLIWDNETVILVDAGLPGQLAKIGETMEKAGVSFDKLNKVIITHHDIDHIGCLPGILNTLPHKVEVLAHEAEKPYIQGEKRSLKATPERAARLEAQLNSLPEERRKAVKAAFENPPKANIDQTVADGEELPYCGGITVIFTPGHTMGHICLYLKQSKTLITGDEMNVVEGRLLGPNPEHSYDMDAAAKSLEKLTRYDIETVVCYHGGLYRENANQRIAELAQ